MSILYGIANLDSLTPVRGDLTGHSLTLLYGGLPSPAAVVSAACLVAIQSVAAQTGHWRYC